MSDETPEDPKIVSLADRRAAPAEPEPAPRTFDPPSPEVISMLEGVLERARTGEVQAVGLTYICDDRLGTAWAYPPTDMVKFNLVAGVSFLHSRLVDFIDGRDKEEVK